MGSCQIGGGGGAHFNQRVSFFFYVQFFDFGVSLGGYIWASGASWAWVGF